MTKTEIEVYLIQLEHQLIVNGKKINIEINPNWPKNFEQQAGVYLIREKGEICYVGETGNIQGRMSDLMNTQNHSIRRNLGNKMFKEIPGFKKATERKKFSSVLEVKLNQWIEKELTLSILYIDLGRKELEERILEKFQPKYNIKTKRKVQSKSNYFITQKSIHKNAYERWSDDDDNELELRYCQGQSIKELCDFFERNAGAIRSRIKKLELKDKYDL